MATRSSILAWKIPWTEEPGRLQSMGSKESYVTEDTVSHTVIFLSTVIFGKSYEYGI